MIGSESAQAQPLPMFLLAAGELYQLRGVAEFCDNLTDARERNLGETDYL